MTNFEKSDIYKKALDEYQQKVYGEILKPLHSIVVYSDEVYLFYNQNIIDDIFNEFKKIYTSLREEDETDFPISIGCQDPNIKKIKFMGQEYKAILLWYDNCDVPKEFQAKI